MINATDKTEMYLKCNLFPALNIFSIKEKKSISCRNKVYLDSDEGILCVAWLKHYRSIVKSVEVNNVAESRPNLLSK